MPFRAKLMRMRPEASAGSKDIWLARTTAGNSGDRSDNLRNHCESAPPGNHWNPSHLAMLHAVRGSRPKNLRNHSKSAPPALLSAREKNEKSWSRLAPGGGQCSGAFAPSKRRSRGDSSDILVVVPGYLFICRAVWQI